MDRSRHAQACRSASPTIVRDPAIAPFVRAAHQALSLGIKRYAMIEQKIPASTPLQRVIPSGNGGRESAWRPLIARPQREVALAMVQHIARRMREPEDILHIARLADQQTEFVLRWSASDLAGGFTGLTLMYSYLATCLPDQGWEQQAQDYLRAVAAETQYAPFRKPNLFTGTSGLLLTLHLLISSNTGLPGYQKLLQRVSQISGEQVLQHQWRRPPEAEGVADGDYDLISGAAGILASLLALQQPDGQALQAIEVLLEYLTWLAEPDQPPGRERWFVSPTVSPQLKEQGQTFAGGVFHCGLAHGIPGPLAALSLAWTQGYRYPGLREAIRTLSNWLLQHQLLDQWGRNWPAVIPADVARSPQAWRKLPGTRAGWCYGAPGVARSLWLAGIALGDEKLCQVAIETIEAALQRPESERRLFSPTLCHGVSGLLQICLHFAHESRSTVIKEHIPFLMQELLETFDPHSPLGFCDIEHPGVAVDRPGWLNGAAGVVMTLLAASTERPPAWDRCLLLS